MLTRIAKSSIRPSIKSQSRNLGNVAVLGATGGIGQPLSLLMKQNLKVSKLHLYDIVGTPGVAADLSHCDTPAQVHGFVGKDQLKDALTGMDLIIIPAGVPRKPGMTRDDLFNTNAGIVAELAEGCAKYCPKAWVTIIANPVNSTVPITAEVFKNNGVDASNIYGVTTLDIVRSEAFVAEKNGTNPVDQHVPVIGGHAGTTIIPLLSQAVPEVLSHLSESEKETLTARIQEAGTEVVKAKDGAGSATLSMAYAGARFADSCLTAQSGQNISEYAYVASNVTDSEFFSSKLTLGPNGIVENHGYGEITDYEANLVAGSVPQLQGNVKKGKEFVAGWRK